MILGEAGFKKGNIVYTPKFSPLKMVLRNPCKKCIVKACCNVACIDKFSYDAIMFDIKLTLKGLVGSLIIGGSMILPWIYIRYYG